MKMMAGGQRTDICAHQGSHSSHIPVRFCPSAVVYVYKRTDVHELTVQHGDPAPPYGPQLFPLSYRTKVAHPTKRGKEVELEGTGGVDEGQTTLAWARPFFSTHSHLGVNTWLPPGTGA